MHYAQKTTGCSLVVLPGWCVYLLFVLALAVGFWQGRRSSAVRYTDTNASAIDKHYFKGLNHLLNEQPDAAIETFIEALEVNSETLETHLALGNLLRRRGETDRAIRIHQNLLARPSLPIQQSHQVQYELAIDFIKAGLFDRAEGLLKELVATDGNYRSQGLQRLLEIYRDEKEWEQGLAIISELSGSRFSKNYDRWADIKAHFHCELAEEYMLSTNYLTARQQLKYALAADKKSVRASLLLGKLEISAGHYRKGISQLQKITSQNRQFFPEALPILFAGYEQLNDIKGYRQFLMSLPDEYLSDALLIAVADIIEQDEGQAAAAQYIASEVLKKPSAGGLYRLLEFYIELSQGRTQEHLQSLKTVMSAIIDHRAHYMCQDCGFKGKQLHWLCPSCKTWGSIEPIKTTNCE